MSDVPRNPSEVAAALRRLISGNFGFNLPPGGTLLDQGQSFDSVSLVQLIALIEEHFQIQFNEDELRMDLFNDVDRLAVLISDKLTR